MDRRSVVAGLGGVAALWLRPSGAAAGSARGPAPLLETDLASCAPPAGVARVAPGDPVRLARGGAGAAVEAFAPCGAPLGPLPSRDGRIVAGLLDAGVPVEAAVRSIRLAPGRSRLRLALRLAAA